MTRALPKTTQEYRGANIGDSLGVPFATVGSDSAGLVMGKVMRSEGIISYVNNTAKLLG